MSTESRGSASTDPAPAAPGRSAISFIGSPIGLGLVIVLVSVPPILLVREVAIFAGLLALCLYPLISAPFVAARPSWWAGALLSTLR